MSGFKHKPLIALCASLLVPPAASLDVAAAAPGSPESWRFGPGIPAPWATADPLAERHLEGATLSLEAHRVTGPAPLDCTDAHYSHVLSPAEGLFQGNLPPPAERAAETLGITRLPLMTVQITCSSGIFDLHLLTMDTALLGLDNVVWTLNRTILPETPETRVQQLLVEHMTGDMGFDPDTVAAKARHLSEPLRDAIAAYFARTFPADEVPPINGDPFTDSQEYPWRFELGTSRTDGEHAIVPVTFGDDWRTRDIEVRLVFDGRHWLVDDLLYEDGGGFRQLLRD